MIKKFNEFSINESEDKSLLSTSAFSSEERLSWYKKNSDKNSSALYKENNHSKLIFIQDNMDELSTEALEEMIDIVKREIPEQDLISNDHPRTK